MAQQPRGDLGLLRSVLTKHNIGTHSGWNDRYLVKDGWRRRVKVVVDDGMGVRAYKSFKAIKRAFGARCIAVNWYPSGAFNPPNSLSGGVGDYVVVTLTA